MKIIATPRVFESLKTFSARSGHWIHLHTQSDSRFTDVMGPGVVSHLLEDTCVLQAWLQSTRVFAPMVVADLHGPVVRLDGEYGRDGILTIRASGRPCLSVAPWDANLDHVDAGTYLLLFGTGSSVLPESARGRRQLAVAGSNAQALGTMAGFELLRRLDVASCRNLRDLRDVGSLPALEHLGFNFCDGVVDLNPLEALGRLRTLHISHCKSLEDLSPLAKARTLRNLRVEECERARGWKSLATLPSLSTLSLSGCRLLDLESIADQTDLVTLDLSGCRVRHLDPIRNLRHLTRLDLLNNPIGDLAPLVDLRGLQWLRVGEIEYSGSLSGRTHRSSPLTDLSALRALTRLESLYLRDWTGLTDISALGDLRQLRMLSISGSTWLKDVGALGGLTSLQALWLSNSSVCELGPLATLRALEDLALSGCDKVQDIEPLAKLKRLRSLDLSGCDALASLRPLAGLRRLANLELRGCESITDLRPLSGMTRLEHLDVRDCTSLQELPRPSALKRLQEFDLEGCAALERVETLGQLRGLRRLSLKGCRSLPRLPRLRALVHLEKLDLTGCEELSGLAALAGLQRLATLNLTECAKLPDLSPIAGLPRLAEVHLTGCSGLKDQRPLTSLPSLESVYTDRPERLPILRGTTRITVRSEREESLFAASPTARVKSHGFTLRNFGNSHFYPDARFHRDLEEVIVFAENSPQRPIPNGSVWVYRGDHFDPRIVGAGVGCGMTFMVTEEISADGDVARALTSFLEAESIRIGRGNHFIALTESHPLTAKGTPSGMLAIHSHHRGVNAPKTYEEAMERQRLSAAERLAVANRILDAMGWHGSFLNDYPHNTITREDGLTLYAKVAIRLPAEGGVGALALNPYHGFYIYGSDWKRYRGFMQHGTGRAQGGALHHLPVARCGKTRAYLTKAPPGNLHAKYHDADAFHQFISEQACIGYASNRLVVYTG